VTADEIEWIAAHGEPLPPDERGNQRRIGHAADGR
jgi:hypothetical protein